MKAANPRRYFSNLSPAFRLAFAALLFTSLLLIAALLTLGQSNPGPAQAQEPPGAQSTLDDEEGGAPLPTPTPAPESGTQATQGAQASEATAQSYSLSATPVTASSTVLTLTGYAGTWYFKAKGGSHPPYDVGCFYGAVGSSPRTVTRVF